MATPTDLAAAGPRTVTNAHCTASALDLGATVLSWRPHGGDEVLFLSPEAAVGEGLELHGGIPICAPWFGRGRAGVDVPRPHGLVRWVPWELVARTDDERGTHLDWVLDASAVAHLPGADAYPADLRFRHEVTFGADLDLRLTVTSPTTEFILDEAFHSYFAVDAANTRIHGLPGGTLAPNHPLDEVVHTDADITIETPGRVLTIRASGAASAVVWNPGSEVPSNFGAEEWRNMVCVEVGNVQTEAVTVPAGGSHTLGMTVSLASGGRGGGAG